MGFFERFVSRRYLFSRANRALVSVITFISIAGVTVGVAALIIVIGVIEGIDKDILGKIVQIYPHLKITDRETHVLADPAPALRAVMNRSDVDQAEPILGKQVLLAHGSGGAEVRVPGQLVGVAELGKDKLFKIPNTTDGSNITLGAKEVILGAPLAYHLGVRPGDKIQATTGMLAKTANGRHPRIRELNVYGIYTTGVFEFDAVTGFISPETARDLFGLQQAADYIHVRLKNPFQAGAVKAELEKELGATYSIKTWEDDNGEFFQALRLEKMGLTVILLLVIIVASFNIIGTLILMVIEKKPEIGILKALGASDGMIRRTFLSAGLTIGTMGTFAGLVLGLVGCYLVKYVIPFDLGGSGVYSMNRLPVIVKPLTVAIILAGSMAICLLAALFPAAQAARLNPVEALRHE